MIGQILSHYRILGQIGAGGMGEVYRAHDERLERDVALKVLPSGTLADEAARRRFRKEALALSKLNHPNVATIFDFDTQEGIDFLVMEYVAGETLSEKIHAGPLAETEIARLGIELAEGLAAAHGQGVIHRDLKPGNVRLMPDGRLKILDFGLAKLVHRTVGIEGTETQSATATESGATVGTLPYMAPEQLRGRHVDARTDFHALGLVLYEMSTGRRPYEQGLPTALIDEIFHKAPTPPGRLRPDLSRRLEEIILKCLEKDPDRRYQSAKEILVDLRRVGTPDVELEGKSTDRSRVAAHRVALAVSLAAIVLIGAALALKGTGIWHRLWHPGPTQRIQSLAVLPFENLSGDASQEYFTDGMTDELISSLAQIGSLRVISRTSIMQYKGAHKSLPAIARELGVQAVVEGSVLLKGERVRVTAQLIDASTDRHVWASSFEREVKDIFSLQSDLSEAIAGAIRAALTPDEEARLGRARPVSPEAYEAYLRGRAHSAKFTAAEMKQAVSYLEDAVARQPDYALAYAEMARDYWHLGQPLGGMPYREAMEKARAAATRALDLDQGLGEAYSALGTIRLWYDWNASDAERLIRRAIELTPGDAFTHMQYSFLLTVTGRPEAAIAEGRRAMELSPLDLIIRVGLAETLYFARRYDESIQEARKMIALDPAFRRAYVELARNYEATGRFDSAAAALGRLWILNQGDSKSGEELRRAFATSGREGYFRWLLEHGGRGPWRLAELGRVDEAIDSLEQMYSRRSGDLIFLHVVPIADPLRSNARFQDLVRRIKIQSRG